MVIWRALFMVYFPFLCGSFASPRESNLCNIPMSYYGHWYSYEDGVDITTEIYPNRWVTISPSEELECVKIYEHKQEGSIAGGFDNSMVNTTLLMSVAGDTSINKCYYCIDVLYRTINILQYKKHECRRINNEIMPFLDIAFICREIRYGLPNNQHAITMFRRSPQIMSCKTTIEGFYQFSYDVGLMDGYCNNPHSSIEACNDPGSPYTNVFNLHYAKCKDVGISTDQFIRYICMGSWYALNNEVEYMFAAVADTIEVDERKKFKCMMTYKDQDNPKNEIRWVMSQFPSCASLYSIYDGPIRLILSGVLPKSNYLAPQCVLPENMSGTWFTQDDDQQFKTDVFVNETHIAFKTRVKRFKLLETYYSCQYTQGTKYMMTKVTPGQCDVNFVCFDFDILPGNHSVVRYRIGEPIPIHDNFMDSARFVRIFQEYCRSMPDFNSVYTNWYNKILMRE